MSIMTDADLTQQSLTVVEAAYRAFGSRDIEGLLSFLNPDVVWGEPDNPLIPSAGTRRGIDGVLDWLRVGKETETILALEPRQFLAQGTTVAVIGRTKVVARPTGKAYETDFVHLVEVRDGRIVRFQEFFDTYLAAEAFRV
jgi:ketosteroid isomerase-like protein